jgi:hypothetical protein
VSESAPEPADDSAEEGRSPTVDIDIILAPTVDEIAANDETKRCEGCFEEQIFGCCVAVRIGYDYKPLCPGCWKKLLDAAGVVATVVKVAPEPMAEG